MTPSDRDLTVLLEAWSKGDEQALAELTPRVYAELHRIARLHMAGERMGHTLQASALINEAYIRLMDWKNVQWKNRCHFFAMGARMMRRVLVDHARARNAGKRAGNAKDVTLDTAVLGQSSRDISLVALDEALKCLAEFDPRKSEIVELRVFGGLSVDETAEVMNIANITVRRDWKLALAWLRRELE